MKKLLITIMLMPVLIFAYTFEKFGFKDFKIKTYCNKVLIYPYQYRCYDYKLRSPRVVLYYINYKVDVTNYKKRLSFKEDKNIPDKYQNKLICYYKSGKDRGHMANDADYDYNLTILKTTYLTSNIVPMSPRLNRYVLRRYENYERKIAFDNDVVVLMGVIPSNKRLKNNQNCANIPKYVYKVIFIKVNNEYKFDFAVVIDQQGNVKEIKDFRELKSFLHRNKIYLYSDSLFWR